jgi:hypothetical protein
MPVVKGFVLSSGIRRKVESETCEVKRDKAGTEKLQVVENQKQD